MFHTSGTELSPADPDCHCGRYECGCNKKRQTPATVFIPLRLEVD